MSVSGIQFVYRHLLRSVFAPPSEFDIYSHTIRHTLTYSAVSLQFQETESPIYDIRPSPKTSWGIDLSGEGKVAAGLLVGLVYHPL